MRLLTKFAVFLAIGVCQAAQPSLSVAVSHSGNFLQGQTNAFFLIRVSNVGTGPTTAAVSVTDQTVTGLQITSLSGQGWTCTLVTCDRSDALAAGKSYPAIVARATVGVTAPPEITYGAYVYFGGDPSVEHSATDTATVAPYGYPVAWGGNQSGESVVPAGLNNVSALAGGGSDTLALNGDGTVVAWGDNTYGETTVPTGLTNVLAIAAGDMQSLALKSDGTVVAWGDNTYGETTIPTGLSNVVGIAAGRYHSLALKSDGTVVAWGVKSGTNYFGQTAVPAGLSNVVAVSAGWYHSVALLSNGSIVAWGYNADGESTPPALTNAVAIAAGAYHTVALKSDGSVVAWGADTLHQIEVPGIVNGVAIAAGWDHGLALQADGTIVGWGYNGYSQLQVPGILTNVSTVAAGGYHSLALNGMASGTTPVTVRASTSAPSANFPSIGVDGGGYSGAGVLFNWAPGYHASDGTVIGVPHMISVSPVEAGATGVQYVFTGWSDGGANSHAVIPLGPTTYTASFTTQYALSTNTGGSGSGTISLPPHGPYWYSAGSIASVTATPSGGSAFTGWTGACTGTGPCNVAMNAPASVTANFTAISSSTPSLALTSSHTGRFLQNQAYAVYLLRLSNGPTGAPNTQAVLVTDTLPTGLTLVSMTGWGWTCSTGSSSCTRSDTLGSGQSYPAIIVVAKVASNAAASLTNVAKLYLGTSTTASLTANDVTGIDATGYPLAWGLNASNQSAVPALNNVLSVAGGAAHSLALKSDGTVSVWGDNSHGQTTLPGGLTSIVAIAAGAYHSLALTSSGTVVAWGDNSKAQLSLPAGLVNPNCTAQACAVAIAAGDYHSLAVMSDGTVVAWGNNADGETTVPAGLSNAVGIAAGSSHTLAVGSDGSVWAWGSNTHGQIGVPSGLTGIVSVAAGSNHSFALSSGGVVAAWGDNSRGQSTVPSGLTAVAGIAAGGNHSLAVTTAGTVAVWGDNTYDQSVVSAGLTKAVALAAGANHSLAVSATSGAGVVITLTVQPGTVISVDGNTLSANAIVDWASGSSHTLLAPTPQPIAAGARYSFSSWSDGGAASHTVKPTAATTYAANFATQYQLTTAVNNAAAGTISPATGGWYNSASVVAVTATKKVGYKFVNWSGACTGTGACSVTMSGPKSVTANFTAIPASLSIKSTHTGNFYRGEPLAYYTLTVTNAAGAGATSGMVTVNEYVPAGMTLVSISGSGWSCSTAPSACTRSDTLAPGASYPAISVGVYVSPTASASASNGAGVSGGNSASASCSDPTTITATAH